MILVPVGIDSAVAQASLAVLPPDMTLILSSSSGSEPTLPTLLPRGISDDGTILTGFQFAAGGFLGLLNPTTSMTYRGGQWNNIGGQINAAAGLPGNAGNFPTGMSGDGNVITGNHNDNSAAYRWTFTGPGPAQGTVHIIPASFARTSVIPFGFFSVLEYPGQPISKDGSTIVGSAVSPASGRFEAFRCVGNCTAGTIQFLGGLVGTTPGIFRPISAALGVNADGSVVVGSADNGVIGDPLLAFYWSQPSGVVALPRPAGLTGNAYASTISDDGRLIGGATETFSGSSLDNATIWRTTGGASPTFTVTNMHDPLVHGNTSRVSTVSGSGELVAGRSADVNNGAWRWTQATGVQNLAAALSAAGVVLAPGTQLADVAASSRDGQFLAVNGKDASTSFQQTMLVRLTTGLTLAPTPAPGSPTPPGAAPPPPGIAGITTRSSVQNSLDDLATARQGQLITHRIMAGVLLGANTQISCGTCVSGFASVGSFALGSHGRRALNDEWTILGGMALTQNHARGYRTDPSVTLAAMLRYDPTGFGNSRPFLDVGLSAAPQSRTRYTRFYANGAGKAAGVSSAMTDTLSVLSRGGWVWRAMPSLELAAYGELARLWRRTESRAELLSNLNPFEASFSRATDALTTVKLGGQITVLVSPELELNLSGGLVHGFGQAGRLRASVAGFGGLVAARSQARTWGEYGARVGYRLGGGLVLDAFVNGAFGAEGVKATIHGGGGLRMVF